MDIQNFERLKESGYSVDWLTNVFNNFTPKEIGKYSMFITDVDDLSDDVATGIFIEQAYFDNPEELYNIHTFFEGFGYVMKEVSSDTVIGEGYIDYSPFDEMEAYTGEDWSISFNYDKQITDIRKADLADYLISHLYEICNENDIYHVLCGIGFTKDEIDFDCQNLSIDRKCQLYPELINHLSEICRDEKDFVDVLRNLGFTNEEIETERLMNYEDGSLATDIDSLIDAAKKFSEKSRISDVSDKNYSVSRDEYQMI